MRRLLGAALLVVVLAAAGPAPVVVSSKLDTEGALLGNVIAEVLRAHGVPVVDRIALGPTSLVRAALRAGQIDIYPEYTGNGAIFFHREEDPAFRDRARGLALDRKLDAANGIAWLDAAPADNTWAIARRGPPLAHANHLATLADLARYLNGGGALRLIASSEFVESPAALPTFEAAYGFHLRASQLLVLSGGDTSATERAAAQGISGVDATMAYGTDAALALLPLVLLGDPRSAETVYAPTPVVRQDVLDRVPGLADWLRPVFARADGAGAAAPGRAHRGRRRARRHGRGRFPRGPHARMTRLRDPVAALLAAVAVLGVSACPFVLDRPDRLRPGTGLSLFSLGAVPILLVLAPLAAMLLACVRGPAGAPVPRRLRRAGPAGRGRDRRTQAAWLARARLRPVRGRGGLPAGAGTGATRVGVAGGGRARGRHARGGLVGRLRVAVARARVRLAGRRGGRGGAPARRAGRDRDRAGGRDRAAARPARACPSRGGALRCSRR